VNQALDHERLRAGLLAHVRRLTGQPAIEFADPPQPLSGGADKDVLAFSLRGSPSGWDGPLVVKLFGEEDDAERVTMEAALQQTAMELGVPAPAVLSVGDNERVHGRHFFVMRRAPGVTLFDVMKRPSPQFFRVTPTLARLQLNLHGIDPGAFLAGLSRRGVERSRAAYLLSIERELTLITDRVQRTGRTPLRGALQWLKDNAPPQTEKVALCHGDLHLSNIVVQDGRVTGVIDWSISKLADPAYDVGRTAILITCGRVDLPRGLRPLESLLRRSLCARFLRIYRRSSRVDDASLSYYRAFHALRSLSMGYAALQDDPRAGAWHLWAGARTLERLAGEFERSTGLSPSESGA
jgi:aminoglycoside phosphotransferase (APT) family kinase protein